MSATPIAFGITDLDIGGAEKQLLLLVKHLDRREWAPEVVCLQPPGPLAKELAEAGVRVHSLHMTKPWHWWRALRAWRDILEAQRPALLQTFLFHANLLGRFAGRQAAAPRIVSGVRVAEPRASHRWLDWLTAARSDCHVCVSRGVAEHVQRHTGVAAGKIVTIPNAVDAAALADARPVDWRTLGWPADAQVAVVVGRLEPQKAPEDALLAFAERAEVRAAGDPRRLLFVGAGSLRPKLEALAKELGMAERVGFAGWQKRPQDFVAASVGLVLPSLWEGMPNAVLEAMALGKPVLATEVEGTRELVADGETGWLVPPSDMFALAERMDELFEDPAAAAAMGAAGREAVRTDFGVATMVERYQRLWRSLLDSAGGAG